jgi:polyisoprenoid-binding protein YceI
MATGNLWRIDPDRSSLGFSIRHALLGQIQGQFLCWGGVVVVDGNDPRRSSVRVWIDLSSIETGSPRQNEQILATGLFDVLWEPGAVFEGDDVTIARGRDGAAGVGIIKGRLSLRNASHAVAVSVEAERPSRGVRGERSLRWSARALVDRRLFGLRRRRAAGDSLDEALLANLIEVTAQIVAIHEGASIAQAARAARVPRQGTPASAAFTTGGSSSVAASSPVSVGAKSP